MNKSLERPAPAPTMTEVERKAAANAERVSDYVKALGLEIGTEVRFLDSLFPLFVSKIGTHVVTLVDVEGVIQHHADPEDIAPVGAA